jgi:hypothetical protein
MPTEQASAFNITIDPGSPSWALWVVNDPNAGVAHGFAQNVAGTWKSVSGPGTDLVGCPPEGVGNQLVPAEVLAYFDLSCH